MTENERKIVKDRKNSKYGIVNIELPNIKPFFFRFPMGSDFGSPISTDQLLNQNNRILESIVREAVIDMKRSYQEKSGSAMLNGKMRKHETNT